VEDMSGLEIFKIIDDKEHTSAEKITLIDAQLRFVREVDGSIEHVTWFVDIDRLTDFMQTHFIKQTH